MITRSSKNIFRVFYLETNIYEIRSNIMARSYRIVKRGYGDYHIVNDHLRKINNDSVLGKKLIKTLENY